MANDDIQHAQGGARRCPEQGPHPGQQKTEKDAEKQDGHQIEYGGPGRLKHEVLLEKAVDDVCMNLKTGKNGAEGGHPQIVDTRGRGPHDDDLVQQGIGVYLVV